MEIISINDMQGANINGYRLQRLLGTGGMAEVWYAENKIGKKAAVKLLLHKCLGDENAVARFENEAKVMVKLEHPNIRQVYDYQENFEGRPAIVMEYLEGNDLKTLMSQGRHFTQAEWGEWWNQMAHALNYTHNMGVVHRDIKPANIFIDKRGNVRLLDFGIAKNADNGVETETGTPLGTRIYMSPEQVRDPKRVDYRTDLYSLAVTFVHLLTGEPPYVVTTGSAFEFAQIALSIASQPLNLNAVPANWRSFLEPYLEKDREKRPQLREFDGYTIDSHELSNNKNDETVIDGNDDKKLHLYERPYIQSGMEYGTVYEDFVFAVGNVSLVMKPVLGGSFMMGADNGKRIRAIQSNGLFRNREKAEEYVDVTVPHFDNEADDDEKPVHEVRVSMFYMGETQVTQALWVAVMGNNPSYSRGDNLPVESVSWNDCQEFIRKLNQLTGRNFRLPTEAEWEYASRGGEIDIVTGPYIIPRYKFAGALNKENISVVQDFENRGVITAKDAMYHPMRNEYYKGLDDVAWYSENSSGEPHAVKTKYPNELGLYDMSGNVWEWCNDWYGKYDSDLQTDHRGPSKGPDRVLRGGSWFINAKYCRVSCRHHDNPDYRCSTYGFRLCLPSKPLTKLKGSRL